MAVTLDSLRKAVKKNRGRSQALAWLADMERASGDYEAALKTVDAALAASPSDIPAMLVRAKILAGQQDFAGSHLGNLLGHRQRLGRREDSIKPSTLPSVSDNCLRPEPSRFIFHTSPPLMKATVSLSSH